MNKFYYIVEEILEFDHEGISSTTKFVSNCPEVPFEWIKNNPIVYDPESYLNEPYYIVTVHEECPAYILKNYKGLL